MSALDDARSIVERTFRANPAKVNLICRIGEIGEDEFPDDGFVVFYLAILSLIQSGQRNQPEVRPVRRWLVRHGYAQPASEWDIPDFQHDRRQWVVTNHPMSLEAIT